MINDKFQKRFDELNEKFEKLPFQTDSDSGYTCRITPDGVWQRWATSAQNLVRAVFGEGSPHYDNFVAAFKRCSQTEPSIKRLGGFFKSAKEDFEGGYVFDTDLRISGEIFGDFIVMAKEALSDGCKDVAAVLACAALEDTLKRYASLNQLDVIEKSMPEVINALKSKGMVSGAQKSLLEAMPKIRNSAMHADWSKISEPEISSVIGFVEQFLLSKFGSG